MKVGRSESEGVYDTCRKIEDVRIDEGRVAETEHVQRHSCRYEYYRKHSHPSEGKHVIRSEYVYYIDRKTHRLCRFKSFGRAALETNASSPPFIARTGMYHIHAARTLGALVMR